MSGIGEFAYTVLLGWMRTVFDWIWLMVSGRGGSGGWQWFLSNWKIWLAILLIGGLVVDWLMWVVRWRPYRLLWGRFRRVAAEGAQAGDEAWDDGIGYYDQETAVDSAPAEWTDMTLRTLSEIDPGWAGNVVIDDPSANENPESDYYAEGYDEPPRKSYLAETPDDGYWEETQDEADIFDEYDAPVPQAEAAYEDEAAVYAEQSYDYGDQEFDSGGPLEMPQAEEAPFVPEAERTAQYGRPGLWPGSFPFAAQEQDDDASPTQNAQEAYAEPLYYTDSESFDEPPMDVEPAKDAPSRRRRRRQGGEIVSGALDNPPPYDDAPAWEPAPQRHARPAPPEDARPSRLVQPPRETTPLEKNGKRDILRTVTGKPAQRRGLMRFTSSEDEPIAGLPPLDLEDPFLPPVLPDNNPDFLMEDGEEFDTEGN